MSRRVVVYLLINIPPSNVLKKCFCKENISKIVRPLLAAMSVNGLKKWMHICNVVHAEQTWLQYLTITMITVLTRSNWSLRRSSNCNAETATRPRAINTSKILPFMVGVFFVTLQGGDEEKVCGVLSPGTLCALSSDAPPFIMPNVGYWQAIKGLPKG